MGGSQYQAKILIDHLVTLDRYDIYYLARRVNPDSRPVGYQIIKIADGSGVRRYGHFFDAPRLLSLLKSIRPDVIYQMVANANTGIAAYYARRHGCRMIWRITHDSSVTRPELHGWRDRLPHRYLERKFTQYGIRHAGIIVAQTDYQARMLRETYGKSATAVIRNYHPVPRAETIRKSEPVKILWVANFKPWKQPEVFIRLAEDLRDRKEVRLIMIGAPVASERWFQDIRNRMAGLDNLEYRGVQTQEQVNALMAESHLLVNTSQHEGFSNTFIQAWMREVPVLSLSVNPDNLLDDGSSIGYCASGNYHRLLERVKNLLDEPDRIQDMGRKSRQYALESHSERNILELMKLIDQDPRTESSDLMETLSSGDTGAP